MKWRNVTVSATRASLDRLETLLWDAGAVSVTVEDGGESPLFEPGPGETPVWDQVVVTGLFEAEIDTSEVKAVVVANNFTVLVVDDVVDRDWEREWLSRFRPMQFGKRLWVCPTTYEVAEPDAVVLHLDPGLAFGTGTHATTRLCLEWLDRHLQPANGFRVMDYGCGSGILGIAALLLGAASVVAVDNDIQALTATRANALRNGVEGRISLCLPDEVDAARFDVVIANILAQPLIELSPRLKGLVQDGGALVMSGIMRSQMEWVMSAYPDIRFEAPLIVDDWVCIAGSRR